MKKLILLALLPALFFLSPAQSSAQQIPLSAYSGLKWRNIGPFRGGRALTALGLANDRNTYYFGAVGGGVWKSTDAGRVWKPIFDDAAVQSIGAIAVAPSDPNIIYVGTGEADMRSDISFGDGVYKSTDAGKSWQHIGLGSAGLEDTEQIGKIIVDPHDPNIVLVAALGHAYGPNAQRGVFRSADGGATWQKVLYKDENTGAIDLCFDPTNSKIVFAALWQTRRPPWSVYPPSSGAGSGLYKSTDGGVSWQQLNSNGLPAGVWGRVGIAIAPSNPQRMYAVIDVQAPPPSAAAAANAGPAGVTGGGTGLYRSDDGGANWQLVGTDPRVDSRAWYFSQVTVDPKNPDVVYLPNVSIYRSTDGGKTFTAFKGAPGGDDYHSLWIDPNDPARMIQASDQGVSISVDEGQSWSSWYNQPTAQFYHVATDNQFPYWVYGAQQDSGTAATTSRSNYGQITYREWHSIGGGESGYIAPDPLDPNIVFSGDTYGGVSRFDLRTGQSQEISPWPVGAFGTPVALRKYRATWTSPLVFSPIDPHALYFGTQYVMRTRDEGASWQQISPDLTGCNATVAKALPPESQPTVENAAQLCYGVMYSIAPSPKNANVIWAGSDSGLIWVTRDGGKNWQNVTPKEISGWSKITGIEASHFDAGTAYVAVDRHRLDDFAPHIYRTADFGRSWSEIVNGIAAPSFVQVVREDAVRHGLLFAGTETGIFVSFDDGDHWQSLQQNLPHASVRDIAIHGNDLVIATHGRAFWILDDISVLRQLTSQGLSEDAHLFQPQTAVRVRDNVSHDTPPPPDTPAGKNPPAGAIIDYSMKADAQSNSPVTLDILDSQNKIVRRYSSADNPPLPAASSLSFPDYWVRKPEPLGTTAGEHRFAWDFRYDAPHTLFPYYTIAAVFGQNTPSLPRGPLAPPGKYQVRLTVDGKTYTQLLTLVADPRVLASSADLAKQFDLDMKIYSALQQDYAAVVQVHGVQTQLQKLQHDPAARADASLQASLAALQTKAAALMKFGGAAPSLPALNGTFAQIEGAVESADRAPTEQAAQAFAETLPQLQHLLSQWQQVQQTDLPALNQMLQAQKLAPITF